jgi:hypothetical protein
LKLEQLGAHNTKTFLFFCMKFRNVDSHEKNMLS